MLCLHAYYIPHYVHIIIKCLQGVTDNKNKRMGEGPSGARLYVQWRPDDPNIGEKLLLTVMSLLPESDVELTSANWMLNCLINQMIPQTVLALRGSGGFASAEWRGERVPAKVAPVRFL